MTNKQTYEAALNELQTIVAEMQDEMVSMDDLSAKVKRAAELIAWCRERLHGTEKELEQLFDDAPDV